MQQCSVPSIPFPASHCTLGASFVSGAPKPLTSIASPAVSSYWQLSGTVRGDLSALGCSLMFLELQNNQLSGSFPPMWAPLLQFVNLANNRVTGP